VTSLFSELRRRNVFRAAAGYAVVAWVVVQAADIVFPAIGAPEWAMTMLIVLAAVGFPLTVGLAWFYELTPKGLKAQSALDRKGYKRVKGFGRQIDFVIILLLVLAVAWLVVKTDEARHATKDRQAQAEKMVEFMINKLGEPLDSTGNLAILDSIGTEVLDYYAALDPADMDEDALARRAKALLMTGKIEDLRGDLAKAEQYFTAAFETTKELLERAPNNAPRMFDHAQSSFYVGLLAWRRGEFAAAEKYFLEYRALAERLVEMEPGSLDYQGEVGFANSTLGTLYFNEGRFSEAVPSLDRAHLLFEKIVSFSPDPNPWKLQLAQTDAWLAEAHLNLGAFQKAADHRNAQVAIYQEALTADPANLEVQKDWLRADSGLAEIELLRGNAPEAKTLLESALAMSASLLRFDASNTSWLKTISTAHILYGQVQFFEKNYSGAEASAREALKLGETLVALDATVLEWKVNQLNRSRLLLSRLYLATGRTEESLALAEQSAKELETLMKTNPRNIDLIQVLCAAYFQAGEGYRALNNRAKAAAAWARVVGLAAGQVDSVTLQTREVLAKSYSRLGRTREAGEISAFFKSIGYRYPDYVDFVRQARN
jgi:tetratricopeptide (TPR) repeat protein